MSKSASTAATATAVMSGLRSMPHGRYDPTRPSSWQSFEDSRHAATRGHFSGSRHGGGFCSFSDICSASNLGSCKVTKAVGGQLQEPRRRRFVI